MKQRLLHLRSPEGLYEIIDFCKKSGAIRADWHDQEVADVVINCLRDGGLYLGFNYRKDIEAIGLFERNSGGWRVWGISQAGHSGHLARFLWDGLSTGKVTSDMVFTGQRHGKPVRYSVKQLLNITRKLVNYGR